MITARERGLALALVALAVAIPALLLASVAPLPGTFGLLVLLLALSIGGRNRPTIGSLPAAGVHLAGLGIALGAGFLMMPDRPFGPLWTLAFLGLAAPRLAWRLTPRARGLVLLFGLLALMGLARAVPRSTFGLSTAGLLVLGVLATLSADSGIPALRRQAFLLPLVGSLAFSLVGLVALGLGLPAAEPAVVAALSPWLQSTERRSGFSEGDIELGQIGEIITSDTVVMRVHGSVDHLRGQVYSDYSGGRWRGRTLGTQGAPQAGDDGLLIIDPRVRGPEILLESEPEAGPPLFAPLGTRRVMDTPPNAWSDGYGIVHVPSAWRTEPRTWRLEYTEEPPLELLPPQPHDLALPSHDAERFRALARAWSHPHTTPLEQIDALRRRFLTGFTYSLTLTPTPFREDPLLFFLETDRRGHCELFAGSLVLLARGLGIPARLIAGYRVFEHNPAGGWFVVRQRDAHAWAEVWLDGAWRTVDPTPPGVLAGENLSPSGWWGHQWDRLKRWARLAFERLAGLTAGELVVILITIAGLIGLLVGLRRRRERRTRTHRPPPPPTFAPLARLEAALATRDPRAPHETLATYAERLRPHHAEAAALIDACAAWLYGGQGDPTQLEADVRQWLARPGA